VEILEQNVLPSSAIDVAIGDWTSCVPSPPTDEILTYGYAKPRDQGFLTDRPPD
jgi:hypothetical protein